MNKRLYYNIYGLKVVSEIECSELIMIKSDTNVDVIVRLNPVYSEIHEQISHQKRLYFSKDRGWFHIDNVATFLIEDGNSITIEVCEDADFSIVKQYLLGSCLGIIMLQRNMLAIHGGAIVFKDKGIIFTGDCGAGKSTITSALRLKGYRFLTDDVSSLDMKSLPLIHPGYPQQKLCQDAMIHFGYQEANFKNVMGDHKMKYLIPVHESFLSHPVPLHAIIELVPSDEVESVELEVLKGYEKLMAICHNIYRIEMKQFLGLDENYFKKCISLATEIPVYRMKRPRNQMTLQEQINHLEQLFLLEVGV